jgi:RNA polymerase sigma-70 factor, ECF subfamily
MSAEELDLGEFFRQHEAVLRGIAMKLCRDSTDANDLVQDTLERALRNVDRFQSGNPRAWLITIMRNLFLNRCRSRRGGPRFEPIDDQLHAPQPAPEPAPVWTSISTDQLQAAIAQLDEKFRRVYELHTFESASYEQISEILNIPKNTVGTRLNRARQKLRELLSAQLEEAARHNPSWMHIVT